MAGQGRRYTSSAGGGPNRKKSPNQDGLWIAVIVLFCIGLWPIALGFMAYLFLAGDKKKSAEDRVQQARVKMDRTIDEALRRVAQSGDGGAQTGREGATQPQQEQQPPAAPRVRQVKQGEKVKKSRTARSRGHRGRRRKTAGHRRRTRCPEYPHPGRARGRSPLFWTVFDIEDLIVGLNFLIGGGVLLGRGLYLRAFARRCRKYVAAVGGADDLDIDLIARRVGRTYDQAVRDMDKMIDRASWGTTRIWTWSRAVSCATGPRPSAAARNRRRPGPMPRRRRPERAFPASCAISAPPTTASPTRNSPPRLAAWSRSPARF